MKTLLITLAALTLLSCDPVKRHQRLVERYPYVHTSEITTVHDTIEVIVPQVEVDTVTHVNFDTIIIEKERLRVQLVRLHDSIYVDAECQSDTVTVTRTIEVPTYASKAPEDTWIGKAISLAWILALVVFGVLMFKRNTY